MSSVSVETCGYIKKDMTWVSWGEVWRKEGKMQRQCDRNKATSWNLAHLHWPFYSQRSRSRGKIQPLASPLEFLWWLRSPFHLHEFPHAPHSFSIRLRVSKCLTNGSYFYCMIPYIYGNKKKKWKKGNLRYQPFISSTAFYPPTSLPVQPLLRQPLPVRSRVTLEMRRQSRAVREPGDGECYLNLVRAQGTLHVDFVTPSTNKSLSWKFLAGAVACQGSKLSHSREDTKSWTARPPGNSLFLF